MKLIITEQQLQEIVVGLHKERYINYLLDKYSEGGLSALSGQEKDDLHKISKGEQVNRAIPGDEEPELSTYDEPEETDTEKESNEDDDSPSDPHLQEMFFTLYPYEFEFESEGSKWKSHVWWESEVLVITNNIITLEMRVFVNKYEFRTRTPNGVTYTSAVRRVPQNEEEMEHFIRDFNKSLLPSIIRTIKGR